MSTNKCDFSCPCGGGQSCIKSRRSVGDWVHEDDVFKAKGLDIRKDCSTPFTKEQKELLKPFGFYELSKTAQS